MDMYDLEKQIREAAKAVIDPAERRVEVLEDRKALKIVDKCGVTLHEVYRAALRVGICPYRYLRNRECLSISDQIKLAESKATIVGAGGLGGGVILLLARMGVGHLVVVDKDVFDETNLNRQALSRMDVIGQSKAAVAAQTVSAINPGVAVTAIQASFEDENASEILAGSDVAVDGLDNVATRRILDRTAQQLGIPLVHGALAGFEGQMMTVFPGDPGMEVLYGEGDNGQRNPNRPEAVLGVPTITPAVISAFQAMEVMKILLKRGRTFRKLMIHVDLETGQWDEFMF
jgi:molybdopterin/thiamine biosynthesis adenylyltransferase